MKRFLALATLLLVPLAAQAESPQKTHARCRQTLARLPQIRLTEPLLACMDFYFIHQELEAEPDSFNYVIRLGYRVLELDTRHINTYTNVSWLLWSKWVTWKESPNLMPDGEFKVDEAIALLRRGEGLNDGSADYFFEVARTTQSLAIHHRPDLFDQVILWYERADVLYQDLVPERVRVRLALGHLQRRRGLKAEARAYFRAVLDIDPANKSALKFLKELAE